MPCHSSSCLQLAHCVPSGGLTATLQSHGARPSSSSGSSWLLRHGLPPVQVSDGMLEAAARIRSLTAVDTGLSSLCTLKGVLQLLQLTGLQALSATGRSAQDFGLLQLPDVRRLASLASLRLLEVRGPRVQPAWLA